MANAAGRNPGSPEERGGNCRSISEFNPHPYFLLLRECNAILVAAAPPKPQKGALDQAGNHQNSKGWKYHPNLKRFADAVLRYIGDEQGALDPLARHIRNYSKISKDLQCVHNVDPWVWNTIRVNQIWMKDLEQNGDKTEVTYHETLKRLKEQDSCWEGLMERKGKPKEDLQGIRKGSPTLDITLRPRVRGRTFLS
jgi:hypothetical protein